ncbi:hypothetical protein BXZ70DRAFT_1000890 [Cristinia sonorae]|uniref:Uncharacterized protein n=1 Tax=Cristinia sonorae TaxID=1940300 RepID=A0A8K0XPB6_9AGAR|nr:hypothetical protein BXZ70DRAFT_1000890 [Cristinia sonorae]
MNGTYNPLPTRYERKMGDTEISYFLPSRQTGVNDMYLHLGFRAADNFVAPARVRAVWAILRLRHPLLCASVQMHDYDDIRFVYDAPVSPEDLLRDADANIEYRTQTKDELIDSYLNGPRTLSNTRLSYLILSTSLVHSNNAMPSPPPTPSPSAHEDAMEGGEKTLFGQAENLLTYQHDLLICAMHFLGDGMALHQFANDFFGLLGGPESDEQLIQRLSDEWSTRWPVTPQDLLVLPSALEDNIPVKWSRLRRVVAAADFEMSQQRLIGGQGFPRRKHPERRTVVPTIAFPEERTKAILKKCKENGVSISAALFAICNFAWARMGGGPAELPSMMYSALNLRPYFTVKPIAPWNSYWFLAIGYFNVILPNFLPQAQGNLANTFWHRARMAKEQSTQAAKSPLVVSRTHEMARERSLRAQKWGKEDDEKEKGIWSPPTPPSEQDPRTPPREPVLPARVKAPSAALIGLSLLGNLDGIYKHQNFPGLELHTLTTGSRQRNGAMLLFGYTFKGKLWISLGYDENGFSEGVVEKFWEEAVNCVDEFLG